jgi:hypothetical protein
MGIGSILNAQKILPVATGPAKADILEWALEALLTARSAPLRRSSIHAPGDHRRNHASPISEP